MLKLLNKVIRDQQSWVQVLSSHKNKNQVCTWETCYKMSHLSWRLLIVYVVIWQDNKLKWPSTAIISEQVARLPHSRCSIYSQKAIADHRVWKIFKRFRFQLLPKGPSLQHSLLQDIFISQARGSSSRGTLLATFKWRNELIWRWIWDNLRPELFNCEFDCSTMS